MAEHAPQNKMLRSFVCCECPKWIHGKGCGVLKDYKKCEEQRAKAKPKNGTYETK